MVDTMIFVYFGRAGLLEALLGLPDLAVTSSVRRELRRWDALSARVEQALTDKSLGVCDVDPADATETTLYYLYRERDGFGDGEATSMAVAHNQGHAFVSHDLEAAARIRGLGVQVLDWPDLLAELCQAGRITPCQQDEAQRYIQGLMKGR